jgi:kynurenine 3-monooxygenase
LTDSLVRSSQTPSAVRTQKSVTVLGAGPAGLLISILLAQRGNTVSVFERLPDLRRTPGVAGRSINLALADRGIHALQRAGVFAEIEPLLMPMRGRMLHSVDSCKTFIAYGNAPHEKIYSISRAKLTAALLDYAERKCGVEIRFRQTGMSVNAVERTLCLQDLPSGKLYHLPLLHTIGADGAGSVLRHYLVESIGGRSQDEMLAHGYKELTVGSGPSGAFRMESDVLHVWPRGNFMLIALPNTDGSFTLTLFLPHEGAPSLSSLNDEKDVRAFCEREFPDVLSLVPDLAKQFFSNPTGSMGTVRCRQWTLGENLVLIGDAAHAIVPFHGQGMNCAFEDCIELDELLAANDWAAACNEFQVRRMPNCNAIATMALENYIEMRDTVRDPKVQLRQALSLQLERQHPARFIPRYSMVMFHHEIPYALALERGRIQNEILMELTPDCETLEAVDFNRAAQLIEARLSPFSPTASMPTSRR